MTARLLRHSCVALGLWLLGCALAAAQQVVLERDSALQAEPRADSATVATLKQGTPGEALNRKGPWLNIKTRSGSGWLFAFNVRFVSAQSGGSGEGAALGRLTAPRQLNVTSTIGVRGLGKEDLKSASFDAQQIGLLERAASTNEQARATAAASGLKAAHIEYPRRQMKHRHAFEGSIRLSAAFAIALVAGALIVAGCGAPGGTPINLNQVFDIGKDLTTAVTPVDEKDEIAAGREIAGRTLGAAHLVADRPLQAYVNRVGRWVAMQSERPELPWHFGVIETSSINAFAAPGGYILVTRGLYELLDNEAQLAGVLGHEIAHVVARHHITVMQKSAFLSAGARAAQRDNRAAFVNNLIGSGAEIFARGLDKDAEFDADRHGVILAARAGYNPFALVDVLQKMQARGSNDAAMSLLFETHPAPTDRLSKLGSALTPRVAALPAGRQPRIRTIAGSAPAQKPSTTERNPKGASALQPAPAGAGGSSSTDPTQLLKGLFGR